MKLYTLIWLVSSLLAANAIQEQQKPVASERRPSLIVEVESGGIVVNTNATGKLLGAVRRLQDSLCFSQEGRNLTVRSPLHDRLSVPSKAQLQNASAYIFSVPAECDIQLRNSNDDVFVNNVNGTVRAASRGGGLRLANLQGAKPVPQASEGATVDAPKMSQEKADVPPVSINQMDISLKAGCQSNSVSAVVKALVENTSAQSLDQADFWLCSGHGNAGSPRANLHHVYLLEGERRKELQFDIHASEVKELSGDQWSYCRVRLPKPFEPGHQYWLQFEYAMVGKLDFSTAPILQSNEGVREIYLRDDYVWCPKPYFTPDKSFLEPRYRQPHWTLTLECPPEYAAVTDGVRLGRDEKDGAVTEHWKSLDPGMPKLFVGPYKLVRRTEGGLTVELYAADQKRLNEASTLCEKYARFYRLYAELFGDPGDTTYRILSSEVAPIASAFRSGQIVVGNELENAQTIAHEMAHMWWLPCVSTSDPGWTFLTEAMAEFSARWLLRLMGEPEHLGQDLSDDWIWIYKHLQFSYFFAAAGSDTHPAFNVPLLHVKGSDYGYVKQQNYSRGPLVVNHLRLILGDEVFFRCLRAFLQEHRTFLEEHRGKQPGIDEFVKTMNTASGKALTAELKGLLGTNSFASYRLLGFVSERTGNDCRTKVQIYNEGGCGVTCPLLLRTVGGDQKAFFKVDAKQEKDLVFTSAYPVRDVLIDPDATTFAQYHPEQKVRLWRKLRAFNGNQYAGKAYMYYALGDSRRAAETMSAYLKDRMWREKVLDVGEFLRKNAAEAPFLFMRGAFQLASGDQQRAIEDIRNAFPFMLRALSEGQKVGVPGVYYEIGAIPHQDLGEYLALLSAIAGREFSFPSDLDESSKKSLVCEWVQWWETTGQQDKLDLDKLKERLEGQRRAFCERDVAMKQPVWGAGE